MAYAVINGKLSKKPKKDKWSAYQAPVSEYGSGVPQFQHSLSSIALIKHNGKRFMFYHNNTTDGRELYDQDENLVLTIDSSLNFTASGKRIGRMQSENDNWIFYLGDQRFDTGIQRDTSVREYCWLQLENAEIAAIEHWLSLA